MTKETQLNVKYWTDLIVKWMAAIIFVVVGWYQKVNFNQMDRMIDKVDQLAGQVNMIYHEQGVMKTKLDRSIVDIDKINQKLNQ